ncbi:MAG: murein biosynthesis integral membrane protein MurJ [Hyphomicrobiaceae bacterium]|nr:murein biosynthesis integral membrane protein MurJ [Hyphomicrobiaceae bacterium]
MQLYRAFATVGGLTLVSRVLGFLRDIALAAVLGAGPIAEAFVVAFRFPNLFRRWFGEGAFNAAFVPLFAKRLEGDGKEAARDFASEAASGLAFVLVAISAVAMIAMPWAMYGLAPGFADEPAKFELAVAMSRIAFPYLLCMSLVALLSGVLNSVGRFAESASISIVLNLTLMAAMGAAWMLGYRNDANTGLVLAWGILAAGLLQLAVLMWGAWRAGLLPRLVRPRLTGDMRRLVRLGIPGIVAGGATQINIVIGGMIASLQTGAVSWLYYADRLYELPLAIIGIAIGVVLLPDISRHLRAGNDEAVMDSQCRALELSMLLTVPAAVALAAIPGPIVSVLFERGAFTSSDTRAVAAAVAIFALGLPAFVLQKVFQPGYFAREDTATPMRFTAWSLGLNTAGSVGLFLIFPRLGWSPHLGIAVATSAAAWVNVAMLYAGLRRRGHFVADRRLLLALPMIVLSSLAMGLALIGVTTYLAPWLAAGQPLTVRGSALTALIGTGAAIYFSATLLTGVLKPRMLLSVIRRRG